MKRYLVIITILVLALMSALGCAKTESPSIEPTTSPASTAIETTSETSENGFFLTVIEPADESIVNTNRVEVFGITIPGAVVSINGDLAEVDGEGNFNTVVFLEEGPNLIEVVASDVHGNHQNQPNQN